MGDNDIKDNGCEACDYVCQCCCADGLCCNS